MASGVPVVQPNEGAFPEIVNKTGGGVIYFPNTPSALAEALTDLLLDHEKLKTLGQKGKEAIFKDFSIDRMAEEITDIYGASLELVGKKTEYPISNKE